MIDKNKFGLVISVIKELQDEEEEGRSGGKKDRKGNKLEKQMGNKQKGKQIEGEIRGSMQIGRVLTVITKV